MAGQSAAKKCQVCKRAVRNGVQCGDCKGSFHFSCSMFKLEECVEDNWRCCGCGKKKEKSVLAEKNATINRLMKELEEEKERVKALTIENEELKLRCSKSDDGGMVGKEGKVKKCDDILVLGDSLIRYSGDVCRREGAVVECLPGIRSEQLGRKIESMVDKREEKVVLIHVGTNDIKRAISDDHVVGEIYDLCTVAKQKFKNAKIIVSGIIKRRDVSIKRIDNINRGIDWICYKKGLHFINPNSWVGERDLARDGLHLNRRGSFNLGKCFSNAIKNSIQQGN